MPGQVENPNDEVFGRPEIERRFQSSLRDHGGKALRTNIKDHRNFPWSKTEQPAFKGARAGSWVCQPRTPQSADDWRAASKKHTQSQFAATLRQWDEPLEPRGAETERQRGAKGQRPNSAPRGRPSPSSTQREARPSSPQPPKRPPRPKTPEEEKREALYNRAMAGNNLYREVHGTAADWRASSKHAIEARFSTSLRQYDGSKDVGLDQEAINNQRSVFFSNGDFERWPNYYGPTSFGGWKRITKENADKVFHGILRTSPDKCDDDEQEEHSRERKPPWRT